MSRTEHARTFATNAASTRPSRRNGAARSWWASGLEHHPPFTAAEERQAAEDIRSAEQAFWLEFLSHGPAFDRLAALLPRSSEPLASSKGVPPPAELMGCLRAAQAAFENGDRAAWSEHSRGLAEGLRACDPGRECMKRALSWAARMPRERVDGLAGRVPSTYARRVRRAFRAQSRAKQRFARANLRLVAMIARRHQRGSLLLEDLIQDGNVGLMIAVERFDANRGFRFSTYASWWIKHTIRRAIADTSRTVRVPVYRQELARQVASASRRVLARTGDLPSARALAAELGHPERSVREVVERPSEATWSLDQPVSEHGGTFLDLLRDEAPLPDERLSQTRSAAEVGALLADLSPIEARVLSSRFGLDGKEGVTLQSLGTELRLSRERVRQIQQRALAQLRRGLEPA